jgi:hypothetical protein
MAERAEKLTGKQAAALAALLASPSVAEAAKASGIGERAVDQHIVGTCGG